MLALLSFPTLGLALYFFPCFVYRFSPPPAVLRVEGLSSFDSYSSRVFQYVNANHVCVSRTEETVGPKSIRLGPPESLNTTADV